ncbi:MAG: NAD(P)-dependent oxidoreductase [Rikenellaceae bacterium]
MKIVFLDEYSVGGVDLNALQSLGEYVGYEFTTPDEITQRCEGAEVVITNKCPLTSEVLSKISATVKLVCIAATGMNNIDLDAADRLGIEVRNAIGYSTHSVAEATLGAALSLRRNISYYDHYVKGRDYSASDRLFCFDEMIGQLHGSRWGIVGLGAIGREVARLATAFGCEVRYYSTSGVTRSEEYERCENLDELLEWCDTLSIHAPLNDQTRGLIGAEELSKMHSGSIAINVARGGIIDEEALVRAINEGEIYGAALDVYTEEPLCPTSPLLTIDDPDRLRLSPHNAWASLPAIEKLIVAIVKNIEEYQAKR